MSRGNRHLQSRLLRDGVQRAKRRAQAAAVEMAAHNQAELDDTLNQISIWAYGLPDGDTTPRALELLANLGWCIGLGATIAIKLDPQDPQARRLHGALRAVHAMCMAGYRWRSAQAAAMDKAAREANALTMANPDMARRHTADAYWLTERIKTRRVQASDVAGAEVYAQPREAATC